MNNMKRGGMVFALGFACGAMGQGYSFTILPSEIPDSDCRCLALAISGDGNVIVGRDSCGRDSGELPWVWRRVGNQWVRSQLPTPPVEGVNYGERGRPFALSFNGDVVVGMAGMNIGLSGQIYGFPAIWRNVLSGQPTVEIVTNNGVLRGTFTGVSADGGVAVFWGQFGPEYADKQVWRWFANGTMERVLPVALPSTEPYIAGTYITASAVSGNGNRFACSIQGGSAFMVNGQNIVPLQNPHIPQEEAPAQYVAAISRDGNVMVGMGAQSSGVDSITWPQVWYADGTSFTVRTWRVPSGIAVEGGILAVSANGAVMGGFSGRLPFVIPERHLDSYNLIEDCIWVNGFPFPLRGILFRQGVSMQGYRPAVITGISDDGSTLVGYAQPDSPNVPPGIVSFVATILPPGTCDDIDFNRDGSRFDPMDIDAFLSVYSEGPCIPASAQCRDIDFNNDGSLFDPRDIEAFLSVFGEGPCL